MQRPAGSRRQRALSSTEGQRREVSGGAREAPSKRHQAMSCGGENRGLDHGPRSSSSGIANDAQGADPKVMARPAQTHTGQAPWIGNRRSSAVPASTSNVTRRAPSGPQRAIENAPPLGAAACAARWTGASRALRRASHTQIVPARTKADRRRRVRYMRRTMAGRWSMRRRCRLRRWQRSLKPARSLSPHGACNTSSSSPKDPKPPGAASSDRWLNP